jgi:hypothetical protein
MRLADANAFRPALLALTKFELEEHDRLRLALTAFQELLDLRLSYRPSDVSNKCFSTTGLGNSRTSFLNWKSEINKVMSY